MAIKLASSDTVRVWAVGRGLAKEGRGRLSNAAIEAFNKSHRIKYARPH